MEINIIWLIIEIIISFFIGWSIGVKDRSKLKKINNKKEENRLKLINGN